MSINPASLLARKRWSKTNKKQRKAHSIMMNEAKRAKYEKVS